MAQRLLEMGELAGTVLDAVPSPIFVVDEDVRIIGFNRAASKMLAQEPELVIRRRAGELLHCVHSTEALEGCGRAEFCKDCIVRNSVNKSVRGHEVVRQRAGMELVKGDKVANIYLLVTTAPFKYQEQMFVLLILEDISELMEMKSLIPICSNCKNIWIDESHWQSVERYLKEHLDLNFTHGICPECTKKLYPDYYSRSKAPD